MSKHAITIDFDSLSPFWLIIDEQYRVVESSDFFRSQKCGEAAFRECFEFLQPVIDLAKDLPQRVLLNRILHIRLTKLALQFRFNAHSIGEQILLVGWPTLSKLEDIQAFQLTSLMRHPACQITDFLILKDVLREQQGTIRSMEVSQYEAELEEQRRITQHQSKLASIGELVAGIAHEINNPLFLSIGLGEMLEKLLAKEQIENPKISEYLKKQQRAHQRIKEIIQALRTYSRVDRDTEEIYSLAGLIVQVLDLAEEIFKKDQIDLIYNRDQPSYQVKGVPGEMQQVLMNLLSNARHATEGASDRSISIDLKQQNERLVVLSVTDHGQGIPIDVQPKIFQPFFTTKKSDAGTGLGLSITQKIVQKMGGEISFKSKEGEGTTFFIWLPLAQPSG
jgi:signal transduction histidine kinase